MLHAGAGGRLLGRFGDSLQARRVGGVRCSSSWSCWSCGLVVLVMSCSFGSGPLRGGRPPGGARLGARSCVAGAPGEGPQGSVVRTAQRGLPRPSGVTSTGDLEQLSRGGRGRSSGRLRPGAPFRRGGGAATRPPPPDHGYRRSRSRRRRTTTRLIVIHVPGVRAQPPAAAGPKVEASGRPSGGRAGPSGAGLEVASKLPDARVPSPLGRSALLASGAARGGATQARRSVARQASGVRIHDRDRDRCQERRPSLRKRC